MDFDDPGLAARGLCGCDRGRRWTGDGARAVCGFSGRAIQILKACGVNDLKTFNVLEDEEVRQGIKDYAQWPTIPQLYVNGEFVGGSDIMMEMYESGELQQVLGAS